MSDNPKLTRAAIMSADPQQLRLWVADMMEPKPADVTVDYLRISEGEDWRYSWYEVFSPGGHWKTNIGTSGDLQKGYFDENFGDSIAVWEPAPDYPSEIGAAWLLHKAMPQKSALRHNRYLDYLKDAISARTGQRVLTWTMVIDLMEPIDICRAAVLASVGAE